MGTPFLQSHHRSQKRQGSHATGASSKRCVLPKAQWVSRPILYLAKSMTAKRPPDKTIEVFDSDRQAFTQLALVSPQRAIPAHVTEAVQVRLAEFSLHRPRQWALAGWLFVWQQLQLDGLLE